MAGILAPINLTARFLDERCEENVWSRVVLEKLTVPQLPNKFLELYATRRFIITPTTSRHLSLSSAGSIQCKRSRPVKNHFNIIVSHLCLGLPVAHFPQFPHKNPFYISLLPPHVLHAHSILFAFIWSEE
jgi:hypothetical protein